MRERGGEGGMAMGNYFYSEVLPFAALLMVECGDVGTSTLFKAASSKGLDYHAFVLYSYALSAVVLFPLAYFFHWKTLLPPFSMKLLGNFLILAVIGSSCQLLGFRGIQYSSPTMGSAMSNLTPACTFVLAIVLRMEKLAIRKLSSQAKIIGTLVSISGAIVVVLYQGPTIIRSILQPSILLKRVVASSARSNWIIGGGLLAADYLLVSVWYIFQIQAMKLYPAEFWVVFYYNLFCTIVSAPACFILQPKLQAWTINSKIALIAILYSGIIGASFGVGVRIWALHIKGPVYVALFRPLSIAIAAIMGVIFLGDPLYLGSVVGAILISVGFYMVMWGKSQEEKVEEVEAEGCNVESTSSEAVPFLQAHGRNNQI